jgi:hypothetical protein
MAQNNHCNVIVQQDTLTNAQAADVVRQVDNLAKQYNTKLAQYQDILARDAAHGVELQMLTNQVEEAECRVQRVLKGANEFAVNAMGWIHDRDASIEHHEGLMVFLLCMIIFLVGERMSIAEVTCPTCPAWPTCPLLPETTWVALASSAWNSVWYFF